MSFPRPPETNAEFYTHITIDSLSTALISFVVLKFIQKESMSDALKGAAISGAIRGTASGLAAVIKTYVFKPEEDKHLAKQVAEQILSRRQV